MSNDYISGLLEAQSEGKLDTYNPTAPVTLEPEEAVPANVTIETEANTVKPEVDLEQVKEITDEFSTLDKFGISIRHNIHACAKRSPRRMMPRQERRG